MSNQHFFQTWNYLDKFFLSSRVWCNSWLHELISLNVGILSAPGDARMPTVRILCMCPRYYLVHLARKIKK